MGENWECWSCRGPTGDAKFCATCGAIQPPDFQEDHFDLLGISPGFVVDRTLLEGAYRQAQQQFHPDHFATRSPTERRLSVEHVTRINEAYRTLREPMARAAYILQLLGNTARGEASDPKFLMTVMELREELSQVDLASSKAPEHLERLRRESMQQEEAELAVIARALGEFPGNTTTKAMGEAARHLNRLRYYRRFLEELERMEEQMPG